MDIQDRNRIATGNGHTGHLIRPKGSREQSNCPLHIDFKMKRPVHETHETREWISHAPSRGRSTQLFFRSP
jgi:hypothetical protein